MKPPKYFYFRVKTGIDKIELEDASDADVVEVVRCKDCKYMPTGTGGNELEWPFNEYPDRNPCPLKCEDAWYSHKPDIYFYCAYGRKREDTVCTK